MFMDVSCYVSCYDEINYHAKHTINMLSSKIIMTSCTFLIKVNSVQGLTSSQTTKRGSGKSLFCIFTTNDWGHSRFNSRSSVIIICYNVHKKHTHKQILL